MQKKKKKDVSDFTSKIKEKSGRLTTCHKFLVKTFHLQHFPRNINCYINKILILVNGQQQWHAFVTSNSDYCNTLLYKLPQYQYDRLLKVLNAAARVTCLIPKFSHITPVLRELIGCHLSELLVVKPRTRYSLRSDSETLLVIPKVTRKAFGDRAFFHAGPTVWNALPSSLRNCRNIDSFKVQLKTYFF